MPRVRWAGLVLGAVVACGDSAPPPAAPSPSSEDRSALVPPPAASDAAQTKPADLLARVRGKDIARAVEATQSLRQSGSADAELIEALVTRALEDHETWMLAQLRELGPKASGAYDRLVPLLAVEPDNVQYQASVTQTLWAVGGAAKVAATYEASSQAGVRARLLQATADALRGGQGTQADVDAVLPMLQSAMASSKLRMPAILALGQMGPRAHAAAPAMGRLLRVANGETRAQIAYALAEIGAEPAMNNLLAVLDEPDTQFRYAAAKALGCIRNGSIVGKLKAALSRPDDVVKLNAASALAYQRERAAPALDRLIGLLRVDDEALQVAAAEAIGGIGAKASKAVPVLKAGLAGGGLEIEVNFTLALRQIEGTATQSGAPACPDAPDPTP
ncbi:MAG: HEAT repeat domain-containing protein [Myxococcota bacterium]